MSCCSPVESDEPPVDYCPDCGMPVDEYGDATQGCTYSPEECATCGWCPCDRSC
jgi:hypothetical protein